MKKFLNCFVSVFSAQCRGPDSGICFSLLELLTEWEAPHPSNTQAPRHACVSVSVHGIQTGYTATQPLTFTSSYKPRHRGQYMEHRLTTKPLNPWSLQGHTDQVTGFKTWGIDLLHSHSTPGIHKVIQTRHWSIRGVQPHHTTIQPLTLARSYWPRYLDMYVCMCMG